MLIKKAFSFLLDCQSVLFKEQHGSKHEHGAPSEKTAFLFSILPTLHFPLGFLQYVLYFQTDHERS